jgi:phosphoesterase RecJ-like protein
MASILLEHGVNIGKIDNLLSSETLELLELKGYCLNNFKITSNGFAYIVLKKEIIEEYKVSDEEAASLVNLFANIKDVPVWAIILESDKDIRIRLRSKGPVINDLAAKYNGGGHKMASGAKLTNWNELDNFVSDVDNCVKKYKETLQK